VFGFNFLIHTHRTLAKGLLSKMVDVVVGIDDIAVNQCEFLSGEDNVIVLIVHY
jgi:hypothetical protein